MIISGKLFLVDIVFFKDFRIFCIDYFIYFYYIFSDRRRIVLFNFILKGI